MIHSRERSHTNLVTPSALFIHDALPILACAAFVRGSTSLATGEINSTSTLVLPGNWPARSDDRLTRTIAHELGHTVGLGHNGCGVSDSLSPVEARVHLPRNRRDQFNIDA